MKLPEYIERAMKIFVGSFINHNFELIFETKYNVYFRLEDIDNEFMFKVKMMEWLSRPAYKGTSKKCQKFISDGVNEYLGTNFTSEDFQLIYTRLGNSVHRNLAISFVKSDYDLNLLR